MRVVLGPTGKKALRWAGWVLLGLLSFVFALQATFPYQRVVDKAVEALSPRYDITIGSVDRGWSPGKMILNAVTLRSRPTKPDDTESTMFFNAVEVDVNLLASLFGMKLDTDLDLAIGPGHLGGNIAVGKDGFEVAIEGEGVPAASMPGLAEAIGLPMTGKVDSIIELDLPKNDWRQATGKIRIVCPNKCTVGDGKTKLKFKLKAGSRQAAFASEGVTIDQMFIDRFALQVDVAKGKLSIGTWELTSGDLEAKIDLSVQLAKTIQESTISSGCVRYKPSETLSSRAPKTHAALMSTGAPLGPDGYYHILLQGRLAEMKRLPRVCGGDGGDGGDADGPRRPPNLGRGMRDDAGKAAPSMPEAVPPPPSDIAPVQMPPPEDPALAQPPPGAIGGAIPDGAPGVDSGGPGAPGAPGAGAGSAITPPQAPPPPPGDATGGMVETPGGFVPAQPAPNEVPGPDGLPPPPVPPGPNDRPEPETR